MRCGGYVVEIRVLCCMLSLFVLMLCGCLFSILIVLLFAANYFLLVLFYTLCCGGFGLGVVVVVVVVVVWRVLGLCYCGIFWLLFADCVLLCGCICLGWVRTVVRLQTVWGLCLWCVLRL